MSGPKVVSIQSVRRQRRESAARLRELSAVLEECFALHEVGSEAAAELRQQTAAVLTGLENLRTGEQWGQLLAQTTAYCQVYRDEVDILRRRAVDHRAAALRREHRRRRGGARLRTELEKLPASTERENALLKLLAAGDNEPAWTEAAHELTRWLADSSHAVAQAQATDVLREMTMAYSDPSTGESAVRLPGAPEDPEESRLDRCWKLLAELEISQPDDRVVDWKQRVQTAAATVDPNQRGLLLDSLALEITSYLQGQRARQSGQAALQSALAEIEGSDAPEAATWRARIGAAFDQPPSAEEIRALADAVHSWLAEEQARGDAREQRAAVLRGLVSLGYEVREGMTAAWLEQGRVVIHKPDDPQYGIEFSAPTAGDAFQARVVASTARSRSQQRDQEVEESWCTELARLRTLLATEGFVTNIVRAHAPGAIPLKTVGSGELPAGERGLPQQSSRQHRNQTG